MSLNFYISLVRCLVSEESRSHPSSTQSRMQRELGDESYGKLSKRRGPSPVEAAREKRKGSSLKKKCAAKANAAKAKGASAGQAQVIYNKCMRAGGDSGDDPSGRAKQVLQGGSPFK